MDNSEFWYLALKKIIENNKKEEQRELLKQITEADEKDTIDGSAPYGCYYSPVVCETCGDRPCDESC